MAQQQPLSTIISVPLSSVVWTDPKTVYKYDKSAGFGVFDSTKGATIFAPENGLLTLLGDGSWMIKTDVTGGTREWIGVSKIKYAEGLKSNDFVKKGTVLGIALEDFAITLSQTMDNKSMLLDPVPYFLMARASFPDDPKPQAHQAMRGTAQEPPRAGGAAVPAPEHVPSNTELARTPDGALATKPLLTNKHLLAVGLGGLGIGALIAYNVRRR